MRLFVAFPVPAQPLLSLTEQLSFEGVRSLREFHCTLKFLGDVKESQLPLLVERLRKMSFPSLALSYGSVGMFPSENSPRVLWVGLQPEKPLLELHRRIEDVFDGLLFEREKIFVPHVTLAKLRFLSDRKGLLRRVKELYVEPLPFSVKAFFLMKSDLRKDGPVHSVIERFDLN